MTSVSVAAAGDCLRELISQAQLGDDVVITEQGVPIARLVSVATSTALRAEEFPVLAKIWDNDDDAIFDTV